MHLFSVCLRVFLLPRRLCAGLPSASPLHGTFPSFGDDSRSSLASPITLPRSRAVMAALTAQTREHSLRIKTARVGYLSPDLFRVTNLYSPRSYSLHFTQFLLLSSFHPFSIRIFIMVRTPPPLLPDLELFPVWSKEWIRPVTIMVDFKKSFSCLGTNYRRRAIDRYDKGIKIQRQCQQQ